MTLATLLDLLLLLGFTLRLIRLVTADALGAVLRDPLNRWADQVKVGETTRSASRGRRLLLADGAECPWCVGFWLGVLALASLLVAWSAGGTLLTVWRFVAGAFALNWVAARLTVWTSRND